jgi:hypothetical protein
MSPNPPQRSSVPIAEVILALTRSTLVTWERFGVLVMLTLYQADADGLVSLSPAALASQLNVVARTVRGSLDRLEREGILAFDEYPRGDRAWVAAARSIASVSTTAVCSRSSACRWGVPSARAAPAPGPRSILPGPPSRAATWHFVDRSPENNVVRTRVSTRLS